MPHASRHTGATGATVPQADQYLTDTDLVVVGDAVVRGNLDLRGSGLERRIGIAHIASNFTTASTSYVDITGASLTITVPTPANLEVVCWLPVLIEEAIAGATAVTSGSRTSGVVTMNSTAHGLTTGRIASVSVADATYNGNYVVASVPTANQFTYAQAALGDDAASGTGLVAPAGNPGAGADIRLVVGASTVIQADSTLRAVTANQAQSFWMRAPLPCSTYTPVAGQQVTFKLQMKSTHATSDASIFVDFAGPQNIAYLEALRA